MAVTYDVIATTTLTSAQQTVTFSGIPSTYTDIKLIMNGTGNNQFFIRFNSDTATNYSTTSLAANGTTVSTARESASSQGISVPPIGTGLGTGQPVFFTAEIFSYANTAAHKGVLTTGSLDYNGNGYTNINVGHWRSNSAITSINCYNGSTSPNQFDIGCTFTIYGILKA